MLFLAEASRVVCNVGRDEPLIRQAVVGGAQIECNTECFWGGYAMGEESLSKEALRGLGEPIPDGPDYMRLSQLASGGKVCAQRARSPTKKLVRT